MAPAPRRRRRPALSCVECRRRKVKCDRNDPCSHCILAKQQCIFQVFGNRVGARQSQGEGDPHSPTSSTSPGPPPEAASALAPAPAPSPLTLLQGSGPTPDSASRPLWPWVLEGQNGALSSSVGRNNSRPRHHAGEPDPEVRSLLRQVQKLHESTASSPADALSETGRDILARQSGLQDSEIMLNKTRILRWSHWMGMAKEFSTIAACYIRCEAAVQGKGVPPGDDPETQAVFDRIVDLLQKCKVIARRIKSGRTTKYLSSPELDSVLVTRQVADTMVNLYFRTFESTHRILHIPSFRVEYERYWSQPETVTTDLRLRVLLVIGIGSSLYDHGDYDSGFRAMVHQWVYTAQAWLSGPMEKDRLDISGIQIHCLTILARLIFSLGGDLVWISMGSLIHNAMQIGLHRDPKHLPAMSVLQAEVRRRLWVTVLEMIVQSSLDSAMPPRISFDEFDTEPPSNNNDDEMDETTTVLQAHPIDTYTSTSMQLLLFDSLPTRLRIVQLLNGLHSELSYTDVLMLSSEITNACRACSALGKGSEGSNVTAFHRNMLDNLVRRFLLPLHCPFASKARTNPLFHYSLKVSLDAALTIVSPEPDEDFSRFMAMGGGMFREGKRYVSTTIGLELIAQVETQSLDGTLHRNARSRELLKQAINDIIALSEERIRMGETNVKSHMFLCMIMAQVEAVESGVPCEPKIAQRARDSLELSYGLLQARADTLAVPTSIGASLTSMSPGVGQDGYGFDLDWELFMPDEGYP